MVSITDCVVEGLKYPFNDIKKLLGLGVFFTIFNLLALAFTSKSTQIIIYANRQGEVLALNLPTGDIYTIACLAIICFIVSIFIMGYQYDLISFSINKREDLPGFRDILNIFLNGIKFFIVGFGYNIIPGVLLIIGLMLMSFQSYQYYILVVISAILVVIAFFLQIMALNNMIANDSLKKAFDFKDIFNKISGLGWVKYIGIILFTLIVSVIIMIAAEFVLGFLTVLFTMAFSQVMIVSIFVGIIEGLFISSYGSIFFARVCGSIYRQSVK